jgi:hypothetical protein
MAFRGVLIKMPEEVIELLDALAPHVGEVYPARVGRTSVLLSLLADKNWSRYANTDPKVAAAAEKVANVLDRSRL